MFEQITPTLLTVNQKIIEKNYPLWLRYWLTASLTFISGDSNSALEVLCFSRGNKFSWKFIVISTASISKLKIEFTWINRDFNLV